MPAGVAQRCRERGVPVAVIVGGMGDGAEAFYELGETVIVPTSSGPMTLENAMQNAPELFSQAADRLFRILKMGAHIGSR